MLRKKKSILFFQKKINLENPKTLDINFILIKLIMVLLLLSFLLIYNKLIQLLTSL